jgi:hypothetical protein
MTQSPWSYPMFLSWSLSRKDEILKKLKDSNRLSLTIIGNRNDNATICFTTRCYIVGVVGGQTYYMMISNDERRRLIAELLKMK